MNPIDLLRAQLLEATTTMELLRSTATTINTAVYLHEQKLEALAYTVAQMAAELDAAVAEEPEREGRLITYPEESEDDSSGQAGGGTGNA